MPGTDGIPAIVPESIQRPSYKESGRGTVSTDVQSCEQQKDLVHEMTVALPKAIPGFSVDTGLFQVAEAIRFLGYSC